MDPGAVDPREARRLAAEHNRRLEQELGLRSSPGGDPGLGLDVGPVPREGGAALALRGRF